MIIKNENGLSNVHYEFEPVGQNMLGYGGMGRVFKGKLVEEIGNYRKERDVALKLLFDDLPQSAIDRAKREASIRIKNDNLVEMIDFVETQDVKADGSVIKHYHIVSEFIEGLDLDDLLAGKTVNHDGRPNSTAEQLFKDYNNDRKAFVGKVFRSILSGVQALHDKGYVHRDIDPSNIMVTSDGKIKLIDFGIARKVDSIGTQDKHLTKSGQFIGKSHYAAPELVSGDIAHQSFTTDIYALGIMLFQFVTGHLPFDGPTHEVAAKQMEEALPLREVKDKAVRKIIKKATEKKQNKRYQSATEFRVDLDKWLGSDTAFNWSAAVKPMAIAAVVAILGVVVWLGFIHDPKPDDPKSNGTKTEEPIPESMEKVRNLLADKKSAKDGLKMLDHLVKDGNYEAAFLKSRLYFDPSKTRGKGFYNQEWKTMRENCSLQANNQEAHALLMQAFRMDGAKDDYKLLYELGCDFLYSRGTKHAKEEDKLRYWGYAKWCFQRVDQLAKNDNKYKKEVAKKLDATQDEKYKSVEPNED